MELATCLCADTWVPRVHFVTALMETEARHWALSSSHHGCSPDVGAAQTWVQPRLAQWKEMRAIRREGVRGSPGMPEEVPTAYHSACNQTSLSRDGLCVCVCRD